MRGAYAQFLHDMGYPPRSLWMIQVVDLRRSSRSRALMRLNFFGFMGEGLVEPRYFSHLLDSPLNSSVVGAKLPVCGS